MADDKLAAEASIIYKILKWLLYAALLTPLWVWSIFLFPFITTKVLYFRLVIEAALVLYIILALRFPELRPRWNWLMKSVWLYTGIILVTSIFGVNFYKSFWGTIERGEGIVTILHFVIYFTILASVFRTKKTWYWFLTTVVLISAFTAIYGAVQLNCADHVQDLQQSSICGQLLPTGGTRISATIGNAAFFAAYMLFGMFLSLYLARESVSRVWKWIFYAVFLFELYILFETQTRGAILAAAAAFFLYFAFSFFKSKRRNPKIISAALLFLLIVSGFIVYQNRNASWVTSNRTLYRLTTISPTDVTTQSRLDTWRASWLGWKDRFFTGYGYENYNIAFNRYFPASIFKDQGSQLWFDRAHDIIFDVGATSGIIGLLAYLGIFAAALIVLWRLFRKQLDQVEWHLPVILAVLLLAYFIQNLFVFDTQATYLMFFTVLAFIAFLNDTYGQPPESPKPEPKSYPAGFVLPAILGVAIFLIAYYVNVKPAFANYYTTQGIKVAQQKTYREVKPTFERALSYGTYMDEEIRQRLVDYATEAVGSGQLSRQEQSDLYQFVITELNKNLKASSRDVKNYLYLMTVLNRASNDTQVADQVLSLGQKAVQLSGTRAQIYFETGQAYFTKKDFSRGLAQFRKAVELNPDTKETHFNFALAAILAGRKDLAEQELQFMVNDLHLALSASDYQNLARAYFQLGDKASVIESYKGALGLTPNDPSLHARLAAAYGDICDLTNARNQVEQTVRLDSTFAVEANTFLNQLAAKCKK